MGGSVTLPEKPPAELVPTAEMQLDVSKMTKILTSSQIGDEVYIGRNYLDDRERFKKLYPEFESEVTGPGGLTTLTRRSYLGEESRCCTTLAEFSYWFNRDKSDPDYAISERALYTCDPERYDDGNCDNYLFDWCRDGNRTSAEIEHCKQWINMSFQRHEIPIHGSTTYEKLRNKFINVCRKDATLPMCEEWLHSLRLTMTDLNDIIIDEILKEQSAEFKSKYMKCSYPSRHTLQQALKIPEARECWDPECATGNINYMLTRNYNNLSLCRIVRCNVSVNNLIMDNLSRLRMSCGKHDTEVISKGPINKTEIIEANIEDSFHIPNGIIYVCVVILIWLLIVMI